MLAGLIAAGRSELRRYINAQIKPRVSECVLPWKINVAPARRTTRAEKERERDCLSRARRRRRRRVFVERDTYMKRERKHDKRYFRLINITDVNLSLFHLYGVCVCVCAEVTCALLCSDVPESCTALIKSFLKHSTLVCGVYIRELYKYTRVR